MTNDFKCGHCGEDVFTRDIDAYSEGEERICPTCLVVCIVSIDDAEDPAVARCDLAGGER